MKLNKMITRIDEFKKHLLTESEKKTQEYMVNCRECDGDLGKLLNYIKDLGNTGHSFSIQVDPESDTEKTFGWDGDGGDKIDSIEVIPDVDGEENTNTYIIKCRDAEGNLKELVEYMGKIGNVGHSFEIVVDPREDDEKKFYWDGDGSDWIKSVEELEIISPVDEKLSKEAQEFISDKIEYLMDIDGMPRKQAVAVAYSYAAKAGFKIPKRKKKKKKANEKK